MFTLTCVFCPGFLTLHFFSFRLTHTLTVFAEVYSSLAENWFCNSLEMRWREHGPRSARGSSQRSSLWGHSSSDRMTYKTACFSTTTSCVIYTPLNPIILKRGRAACVLQISPSGSPVLQLHDSQVFCTVKHLQ